TRISRTIVASRNTAIARPNPKSLMSRSSPSTKALNTKIMISAAAVITQAVGNCRRVVPCAVVLLSHAREQEHLVVHREAEDDREQHHRGPRLDGTGL